jgi:hypothetical protein
VPTENPAFLSLTATPVKPLAIRRSKKQPSADNDADHKAIPEKTRPIPDRQTRLAFSSRNCPPGRTDDGESELAKAAMAAFRSDLPAKCSKCRSFMQPHPNGSLNQKSLFLWHTYC